MSVGGRGVWNKKYKVDESRSLDILDLQREKVFSRGVGKVWTTSWSRNGKELASILYRVELGANGPFGLRFMYTITDKDTGEKKDYNYVIPVVATSCNYGGKRWWYACPLVVNGHSCQRRCRIIYMPPDAEYFGCRECHRLTYESRQRHRDMSYEGFEKPYKAAKVAREKLTRIRSWKKKEKLWLQLSRAHTAMENYADILTNRRPKIIYKRK